MLNFSDTVWVLMYSSSLPALDGALESSKGDANGPNLLLRLPAESELQLDLREDVAEMGDVTGESSSWNLLCFDFFGGNNSSADSPGCWYSNGLEYEGLLA
jgi:hypothetical protein